MLESSLAIVRSVMVMAFSQRLGMLHWLPTSPLAYCHPLYHYYKVVLLQTRLADSRCHCWSCGNQLVLQC